MATAIYSTTTQSGIDINSVFYLDTKTAPEYPAPPFLPGELAWGTDGSEWVYATSSVTISAGSAVLFNVTPGSWSVALLSNANGRGALGDFVGVVGGSLGSLNVSQPTGTQTASYFWVQRAGNCPKLLSSSVAANAALHTQITGGLLGGTGGVGTSAAVSGVVFSQTAGTSGTAYNAILNYPTVGAND